MILNDVVNLVMTVLEIDTRYILRKPNVKNLTAFVFCRIRARVALHAAMMEVVWKNYYLGTRMMEGLVGSIVFIIDVAFRQIIVQAPLIVMTATNFILDYFKICCCMILNFRRFFF